MYAVSDNVGAEIGIGENFAENAGLAMIECPHGIERVRGMAGSGANPGVSSFGRGVRMSNAYAHVAASRLGNHFDRSRQFGRNGQHAHVAACSLPKPVEDFDGGRNQIFRRMHAAALLVLEKRSTRDEYPGASLARHRHHWQTKIEPLQ